MVHLHCKIQTRCNDWKQIPRLNVYTDLSIYYCYANHSVPYHRNMASCIKSQHSIVIKTVCYPTRIFIWKHLKGALGMFIYLQDSLTGKTTGSNIVGTASNSSQDTLEITQNLLLPLVLLCFFSPSS